MHNRKSSFAAVTVHPPSSVTSDVAAELDKLAEELTEVAQSCQGWQILSWRAEQLSHMSTVAQEWAAARNAGFESGDVALVCDDDADALGDIDASIIVGTPNATPSGTPFGTPVKMPPAGAQLHAQSIPKPYRKALGVYEVHKGSELVNARPVYKAVGHPDVFMFYSGSAWVVGHDITTRKGFWRALSNAISPVSIDVPWEVVNNDTRTWDSIQDVHAISRAEHEERLSARARKLGDVALSMDDIPFLSHDDIPSHADKLGIFELDEVGVETDGQTDESDDGSSGDGDSDGCDNDLDPRWLALAARDRVRWGSYDVWRTANTVRRVEVTESTERKGMKAENRDNVVLPLVNGRPRYKLQGHPTGIFLFFAADISSWLVGSDSGTSRGFWMVHDTAMTPDKITEKWEVLDSVTDLWCGEMARICSRQTYENRVRSRALDMVPREFGFMSRTATDFAIDEKHFGMYSLVFNDSDGEVTLVNGRPVYRHADVYLFFAGSAWLVGSNLTQSKGFWMARSGAITPELIREQWHALGDSGMWTAVDGVGLLTHKEYDGRVHERARTLGDVALNIAVDDDGSSTASPRAYINGLGLYLLQNEEVRGRPLYKLQGCVGDSVLYLFFTGSSWAVGPDSDNVEHIRWMARSGALTPDKIRVPWNAVDEDGVSWKQVPNASIIDRTTYERHVRRCAKARGDLAFFCYCQLNGLEGFGDVPYQQDLLGIFELDFALVNSHPVYKLLNRDIYMFHSGESWMLGSDTTTSRGCWMARNSSAMTPESIDTEWSVCNSSASQHEWIRVQDMHVTLRADYERYVQAQARLVGQIIFFADEDVKWHADKLGRYSAVVDDVTNVDEQSEHFVLVNGRPLYKREGGGREIFMFFTGSAWAVGASSKAAKGCWMARSGAIMPNQIQRQCWQVVDSENQTWASVESVHVQTCEEYAEVLRVRAKEAQVRAEGTRRARAHQSLRNLYDEYRHRRDIDMRDDGGDAALCAQQRKPGPPAQNVARKTKPGWRTMVEAKMQKKKHGRLKKEPIEVDDATIKMVYGV